MLANWTKATTTTNTNGTITLTAVTGYPLPSKSRVTGEYVEYSIHTSDGKFESGIGKIAASEQLERTRVISTYDGTTYNQLTASALTLASGTHDVFITPMAEGLFEPLRFPLTPVTEGVISTHLVATQANVGTAAIQRNTAWPFILQTSGLLTAMGIRVGATGASSTTLLGLYEPKSDGTPGRLIAKTSTTIDTSTGSGSFKSQAVDSNVRLTPGVYWAAICVTAGTNPTFTGSKTGAHPFGNDSGQVLSNVREDTTATTMADPFPSTSLVYVVNTDTPYIHLILA